MIDFIMATAKLILTDWQRFLVGGMVVVWAIITFEGFIKIALNKIFKNKTLRGIVLALFSLVLVFPATAFYLWIENISFDYYWFAYPTFGVATVVTYWVYEYLGIRLSVKWILEKIGLLLKNIFDKIYSGEKVVVKEEISNIYNDIKKNVVKKAKKEKKVVKTKNSDLDKL